MKVIKTNLEGVIIIEPEVFGDERGFFKEMYQEKRYADVGIELDFVQDNCSRSCKGVLRGLHFQIANPQGKLVSCLSGIVYDVIADINPLSPNFGEHVGVELSGGNHRQVWVPPGFAHGFCVLSDFADFYYKCTEFYNSTDESGILWSDPDLSINWPIESPLVSDKDQKLGNLKELRI